MNSKKFIVSIFLCILFFSILLATVVKYSFDTNPLNTASQKRITDSHKKSEIVFVGDSSLGHGLDEKYFSELLNNKSVTNLSLTAGAHNFSATFNMIRHTIINNKEVKYIIIMQTPFVWYKEFVEGGYCSTLGNLDNTIALKNNFIEPLTCFKNRYLNLKLIYETWSQKKNSKSDKESIKTYKNGGRDIFYEISKNQFKRLGMIGSTKLKEIKMIDDYLKNKNVKVYYVQGSLHYQLSVKYNNTILKQQDILKKLNNIIFIEEYLYPKNENMGNTENHVDESYKKESTEFYYKILRRYLK